jgi:hypothetical protein
MLNTQAYLIAKAQEVLRKKDESHLAIPFDVSKHIDEFEIGSYVLLDYNNDLKERGPPHKLMPFKKGPFRVVNMVGSRYTLLDLINNKHVDAHITQLTPFHYDSATMDPKTVAARDNQEYVVEQILKHRGDKKFKSTLQFLVRWKGYGPEYDTWEPWKNLRLVDKLHTYLAQYGMKSLIPSECLKEQTPELSRNAKRKAKLIDHDLITTSLSEKRRKRQ